MTAQEKKDKFVQSWGSIGSNWGINRTMAQIHALLLISDKPLSANQIKEHCDMPFDVHFSPELNENAVKSGSGIFQEFSAQEFTESQNEHSEKFPQEFLRKISVKFRIPLSSIY